MNVTKLRVNYELKYHSYEGINIMVEYEIYEPRKEKRKDKWKRRTIK
jgi:hypothetical protein